LDLDDPITGIKCPLFVAVGAETANCDVEDLEDFLEEIEANTMMVLVHVSFYLYCYVYIHSRVATLCYESQQKPNIATDSIKQWWTNL